MRSRIERSIINKVNRMSGTVLLTREVAHLGSERAVAAALSRLISRGLLLRIGKGIYAKNSLIRTGEAKRHPQHSLEVLACEAFKKLNIPVALVESANRQGSDHSPSPALDMLGRRTSRKISDGKQQVQFLT